MAYVEINLDEFSDDEIIEELKYRKRQSMIDAIEQGRAPTRPERGCYD